MSPGVALLLIAVAILAFGVGAILGFIVGARSARDQLERWL